MDYIPDFIARKHGKSPIVYDIPIMEKYLKDTYGVTVYQEQVMLLSRLLANFTRGESDTLRKAMGKKLIDKMNHLKDKFLEGGQANGHDPKVLEKIWADWEKFASYAFNKSHATCYSWVAFQTAYLKANYPAEFMAAVLSRNRNDITKLTGFMDECKAMHIPVKGPDVNESFSEFGVNKHGDIRFGLSAIKGVGENVATDIINARNKGGQFTSIYDFVERVPLTSINRRTFESLAVAGAFDCFPEIRREDFFLINNKDETFSEAVLRYGQLYQNATKNQIASLFGDEDLSLNTAGRPPIITGLVWPDVIRLNKERDLVGMYLSAHPLDPYYIELKYGCNSSIKEINEGEKDENREYTFGGMVVSFESKPAKRGGNYGIFVIEDLTGSIELRVYDKDYIKFAAYGRPSTPILITGRYYRNKFSGELRFCIQNMRLLEEVKGKMVSTVIIKVSPDEINDNLKKVLLEQIARKSENPGTLRLEVYDPDINRSVTLQSDYKIPLDCELTRILDDMQLEYSFTNNMN